ncbi:MAG: type II secretion system F family protein [Burkholderiales bacterium]|nr:type II secretion system F family protein [Burkholderiales bacterium]MDE1925907.1 type II secretion system F family protein [Burkholderiales bacterium]MDE2157424.1 type II secretion system F family protein [Burkholderiales bacterium]
MLFNYEAIDGSGAPQRGAEEAESEAGAVAQLARRGLTALTLRPARPDAGGANVLGSWKRREGGGRVALVLMVRELASLLGAGVTLEESLRTLIESRRGLALEAPLTGVLTLVLAGERFSSAVRKQSESGDLALPSYVVALISAGESTGDLAAALGRAAEQLEFDEQVRAETSEALVYPIILVLAGAGAVLFVFSFVVPRFSKLLAGRQVDLPWLSAAVLGIGDYFDRHGALIGIALATAAVLGASAWKAIGPVRIRGALSRLPVLGTWIRQQELSRWTGMLALMLQSRVPILTALDLTAQAMTLAEVSNRLRRTMGDIGRGESLSRSLDEYGLLPATALSMVRVGERTGNVGVMMGHVATHALEQNRRLRKRLVALIEPAAIIVLGGIIAMIIVGVMLALTSLSDVKF